jgi:hypothetical protein
MRMLPGTALLAAALLVVGTASPAAAAAPDTVITSGPADTARVLPGPVTYTFEGVPSADSFECSVDGSPFAACTSPQTFDLPYGSHIFQVRAKIAGDTDATPALRQWIVRNVPCEEATAQYNAAKSSFFKHHTRLGYTKEKLQRAKDAGNQKLIEKYTRKKKKLQKQIKADQAAMDAALAQEQAVC